MFKNLKERLALFILDFLEKKDLKSIVSFIKDDLKNNIEIS